MPPILLSAVWIDYSGQVLFQADLGAVVACKNGRVKLRQDDDRLLFAESAGTCLICNARLFRSPRESSRSRSITDRAHVLAHSRHGPRRGSSVNADFIDSIDNLILLCPSCHRVIDKAEDDYPPGELFEKKRRRAAAVSMIGGTPLFADRKTARQAVTTLLAKSRSLFETYGPDPETGLLPSQEASAAWSEVVLREIVPNHRLISAIVVVNTHLADDADVAAVARLDAHARDLADKHSGEGAVDRAAARFPVSADDIFAEGGQ